jgi:hypothetical protein
MRDQIENGIHRACALAGVGSPHIALSDHEVSLLADKILAALAATPAGTPAPAVVVLPEATPVVTITPADVVASIAASSARTADRDSETIHARLILGRPGMHHHRFLGWRLMAIFGVHTLTNGTSTSPDGSGTWRAAGRPSDLSGWRNALDTLLDAGQSEADRLDPADRDSFWQTLGTVCRDTDRARARIAAAADRQTAAKTACYAEYGAPTQVPAAATAPEGSPVAQAAHRALATAALT